ncbi:MAG: putative sensor domain DACNV-containing protein [Candidatus Hodarchaeota archaeon]
MFKLSSLSKLSQLLLNEIEYDRNRKKKPIVVSAQTIKQVFEAVYAVSLRPEEGRYPKFTIALSLADDNVCEDFAFFNPPLQLSPNTLHRIWPSVPPYPHVLMIFEDRGVPFIRSIEPLFSDHLLLWSGDKDTGALFKLLFIHIRGPGDLVALYTGSRKIYAFQGGRILTLKALSGPQISSEADQAFSLSEEKSHNFWIPTLQRISAMRHGGTIVQLPPDDLSYLDLIRKYKSKLSITYCIGQYRNPFEKLDLHGARRRCGIARSLIASYMSSVDGCVVLNHAIEIMGFGAKLRVDVADTPRCVDWEGNSSSFKLGNRGMRHRSAANFAFEVPLSTAVVVSQDGEIHVFRKSEDNESLVVYGPFGDIPLLSPPLLKL